MANKLKNLQLTSVDLVRAGANQEADIMLHKSAAAPEATETPTEPEKNILKRFIDWLQKTPQEAEIEAENTIEKADETAELYKDAITKSIQSIVSDETLTPEQKNTMIEKSLGQYHEKMAEIAKYNHYHGKDGRFTSANGGGGAGPAIPDMVGFMSQGMKIDANGNVVPDGSHQRAAEKPKPKASGKADRSKLTAQMEDLIRRSAEEATKGNFKEADKLYEEGRKIYDQLHKSAYDTIDEVEKASTHSMKSIDTIEEVAKFNPYHGKDGRFASKNGGGAAAGSAGGSSSNKELKDQIFRDATSKVNAKQKQKETAERKKAKEGLKRVEAELKTVKDPKQRIFLEASKARYESILAKSAYDTIED